MRAVFLMCSGLLAGIASAHGETVTATPIARPLPEYPAAAGTTEGSVKLRFTIGKDGSVANPSVVESNPPGLFDAAAVAGVRQWTFRPRLVDGKAADQDTSIVIRFVPPPNPAPVWLNPTPPYYPRQAFSAKLEGKVTVGFDVTERGTTANVHIIESTPPGIFDSAAIEHMRNRYYQPVIVDGRPQPSSAQTTTIEYKLADAKIGPKPTHIERPVYPSAAEYAGANGFCALDLTIADDGSVAKAIIDQSFPRGVFEESCMSAVKHWRFETRQDVGAPVAQHIKYMVSYRIEGQTDRQIHYLRPGQWIELEYTLTAEGRPKDIKVAGQSEPNLPTSKAVDQLRNMKLNPVIENGVAVEQQHLKIRIN